MHKHLLITVLALICSSHNAHAESACDIVLKARAFNKSDIVSSENIIDSKRAEFCKGDYSSTQDAKSRASASGLDIGYELLSIGGTQQDKRESKHYEIKNSKFCSMNKSEFIGNSNYKYSNVATDTALNIWLSCIKQTNGDVYAEWSLMKDARSITGKFHFGIKGKIEKAKISGVNLVPTDFPQEEIQCQIAGQLFTAADLNKSGLTLDNVETEFACSKIGNSKERDLQINFVSNYPLGFMSLSKPTETCSLKRAEVCGVQSYNIKQSGWCGSTPNTGTGPVCGIATWKSGKGEACGVNLTHSIYMWPKRAIGANKLSLCKAKGYDMTTGRIGCHPGAGHCTPEPNNNEFLECGTYKTCTNEAFGPETYKSCADISFGSTNKICEHEQHGVHDYKECLVNDANGKLCTSN